MDKPHPTTPGERFLIARKRSGLTQSDVAALADVRQSTVSEFETNKIDDILASSLVRMCRCVGGITVEYAWLGAASGRAADEDEVIALLRSATDERDRRLALKALRSILGPDDARPPAASTQEEAGTAGSTFRRASSKGKAGAAARSSTSKPRARKPAA